MALFVALVLGLPACLRWGDLVKFPFDEATVQALENARPECVFIGDSMLRSRIDAGRLNQLAHFRCNVLAYPGTGSAVWYLIMENIVGALAHPPQLAVIFFRDRQLTLPALRTEGRYRNGLEVFMRGPEPRFEEILDSAQSARARFVQRILLHIYPAQKHRLEWQEDFQDHVLKLAVGAKAKSPTRARLAEIFGLKNLRHHHDLQDPLENEEKMRMNGDNQDFAEALKNSFLPMILKTAKDHQIQVTFFRVKCRPHRWMTIEPDRPALRQYIRDLDAYLKSHGAIFVDESQAPEITEDFYGEGDHIADAMMRPYTEIFWRRNGELLTAGLKRSAPTAR